MCSPDSTIPKITGVDGNTVFITCDGCGKPDSYLLASGYKIVKTAVLVEVGTQTGPDFPESRQESSTTLGSKVGCLDNEMAVDHVKLETLDTFYYDSASVPTPVGGPSYNGNFLASSPFSQFDFDYFSFKS